MIKIKGPAHWLTKSAGSVQSPAFALRRENRTLLAASKCVTSKMRQRKLSTGAKGQGASMQKGVKQGLRVLFYNIITSWSILFSIGTTYLRIKHRLIVLQQHARMVVPPIDRVYGL